jgi:hypothetical protein
MLMLAPFGRGVPSVTVPTVTLELRPPPRACAGGVSIVVANIGQMFAGQAGFGPVIMIVGGCVGTWTREITLMGIACQ